MNRMIGCLLVVSAVALPLAAEAVMPSEVDQWMQSTELQPLDPEVQAKLQDLMRVHATHALARLAQAKGDEARFNALPSAAVAAYDLRQYDEARELAREALGALTRYRGLWSAGNAIHDGHMTLGLVALRDGDVSEAVVQLRLAGETPGSPQLGSFGPSMKLARALLLEGQTAPVLAYLEQCRRFWGMGSTWLDVWEAKVRAGQVPNFIMHAYR